MTHRNEKETAPRRWPVVAFAILVLATGLLQLIFVPRAASQTDAAARQQQQQESAQSR